MRSHEDREDQLYLFPIVEAVDHDYYDPKAMKVPTPRETRRKGHGEGILGRFPDYCLNGSHYIHIPCGNVAQVMLTKRSLESVKKEHSIGFGVAGIESMHCLHCDVGVDGDDGDRPAVKE